MYIHRVNALCFNYRRKRYPVQTEESVVVVEGVSSYQVESVIYVARAANLLISRNPLDAHIDKLQKSDEGERAASEEHVRIETVCKSGKLR